MALDGLDVYPDDVGDSWRCLGLAPADGAVVDDMMVQQRFELAELFIEAACHPGMPGIGSARADAVRRRLREAAASCSVGMVLNSQYVHNPDKIFWILTKGPSFIYSYSSFYNCIQTLEF